MANLKFRGNEHLLSYSRKKLKLSVLIYRRGMSLCVEYQTKQKLERRWRISKNGNAKYFIFIICMLNHI